MAETKEQQKEKIKSRKEKILKALNTNPMNLYDLTENVLKDDHKKNDLAESNREYMNELNKIRYVLLQLIKEKKIKEIKQEAERGERKESKLYKVV